MLPSSQVGNPINDGSCYPVPFPEMFKVAWRPYEESGASKSRAHLTPDEVERMIVAAPQRGRYGNRDALLIMLAYRHGLRASELIALRLY
jgi:integrase